MTQPITTLPTPGQEDRCAKGMHADRIYVLAHARGAESLYVQWCGGCGRVTLARARPGTTSNEFEVIVLREGDGQKELGL